LYICRPFFDFNIVVVKNPFEIPFVGLKIGKYEYEFEIDKSFFEKFPNSLIEEGELVGVLELEKKETMLIAEFSVAGFVTVNCARCNEEMEEYLEGDLTIYYKFGTEEEEDENLIVLSPDAYLIDVSQPLYELITVSLPSRTVHDEGECDEEIVKLLEQHQQQVNETKSDNDIDPRWAALKNLN